MKKTISKEKVDNDLYLFLCTMYHFERTIAIKYGLDYQEIYCLQSLRRSSPQRLTEIAETLEIPMFTASRLVGRLVEEGFVAKVKGSQDRRSVSLSLQPKGDEIVRTIEEENYKKLIEASNNLDEDDLSGIFTSIEKMYKLMGTPEVQTN